MEAATSWANWNAKRWSDADAIERSSGLVVCDTDPLRLHYNWGLWQIGESTEARWQFARQAVRRAIAVQRLGFADLVLVKPIDVATARLQKACDLTRTRKLFKLHLSLPAPFLDGYRAIECVFPGSVYWGLPGDLKIASTTPNDARYDLNVFDSFVGALPSA